MFLLTAIIGFFVGSLFVNLFGTTYDSMLVCYLVEQNIMEKSGRMVTNCPEELKEVVNKLNNDVLPGYSRLA